MDWYYYGARFYDPAIARFFTQDRFAEKYLDLSPYQYCANNPINLIDLNGDSIWFTYDYNAQTNKKVYIMHITAVVYDGSTWGNYVTADLIDAIKNDLESTFSGESDMYEYACEATITKTEDKNNIGSNHLMEIRDREDPLFYKSDGIYEGKAKIDGKHMVLNEDYLGGILNGRKNVVSHEFGHNAGLVHPSNDTYLFGTIKGEQYMENDRNNLMHKTDRGQRSIIEKQMQIIHDKWKNNKLNKNKFFD